MKAEGFVMSNQKQDRDTERFYKLSYLIIPLPMVAGVIFAGYVLLTEDSRNQSFCAVANTVSAYSHKPISINAFSSAESITLDICKEKDQTIDQGDGRDKGLVRWYVCKGTVCGQGWEKILGQH